MLYDIVNILLSVGLLILAIRVKGLSLEVAELRVEMLRNDAELHATIQKILKAIDND